MMGVSLEQAVSLLLEYAKPIDEAITLPLSDALGLVAAEDVCSPIDNPPFDRSPLDGFALRSADVADASPQSPARLTVVGELFAGDAPGVAVTSGQAVRIMTGAAIPAGCDCVVRQEDVSVEDDVVAIPVSLSRHQNYCFRGEDIQLGQRLISAGDRLTYVHLGILASVGFDTVTVIRPPRIGLLCTGDELIPPGKPLAPGKIYNSNEALLAGRLESLGLSVTRLPAASDAPEVLAAQIAAQTEGLDLLITTGGVSVGARDFMPEVMDMLGAKRLFWGVNLKPGTPALASLYRGSFLLCLSGNPFAAITTMELLARPLLTALTGWQELELCRTRGVLQMAFPKNSGQRRLIRAKIHGGAITLPESHASGQLFSMLDCNCLVDIPAGTPALQSGDEADVVLL